MSVPIPEMCQAEIEAVLEQVARGTIRARTAIALMVHGGVDPHLAAQRTFLALGGSDTIQLDAEGRPRYAGSGKLVTEIEAAIAS